MKFEPRLDWCDVAEARMHGLRACIRPNGLAVTDEEIINAQSELGRLAGIFAAPEGAATYAAVPHLLRSGFLQGDERIVLFNTGMGLKYAADQ